MARTVTGQQATDLAAARRKSFLRVRVQDADGTWVNLSNLDGKNYVQRASGRTSLGQNVATANVELIRSAGGLKSLSPLREDSDHNQVVGGYAPLLDAGRSILIEGGVVAPGATIQESDYQEIFRGEIQRFSANKSPIRLELVGQGHKLIQAKVRRDSQYGTEAGRPMEDVAQDIIDDWGPAGVSIYTPTSPAFAVTPYLVDEQSVFDAELQLWAYRGWTIAYKWDNGTGAFRLTAYEPDRTKTAIDWTFPANRILNVRRLDVDRTDIINSLDVEFRNAATGQRETVSGTDPDSIARFNGEQWAAIRLSDDSPVDTTAEAMTLKDAALSDMAYPAAELEVEVPFHWAVEIGDMCRLGPDGRGFSVAQDQAVTQVDWTFSDDTRRTILSVRGKPAGQYLRYRQLIREARKDSEEQRAARSGVELGKRQWDDEGAVFGLLWGSGAREVRVWDRLYVTDALPSNRVEAARFTEPADDAVDFDYVQLPGENNDVLEFDVPTGKRQRWVTIRPVLDGGAKGQGFHFPIYPTQSPADAIHSAQLQVNGVTGAVRLPVVADPRLAYVAVAYNVGPDDGSVDPPGVSSAESPTGAGATGRFVLPITGSDVFALPAGTVGDGQAIAAVFIGYLGEGVGPNGHRDDHGDPVEAGPIAREKPLVAWEQIVPDDSDPETGYITAVLSDPGGYVQSIRGMTKTGEAAWTAESIISGAPVHGDPYILDIPKTRNHQSAGRLIARGVGPANEKIEVEETIGGFDYGLEPAGSFQQVLNEDGTVTGFGLLSPDAVGGGMMVVMKRNAAVTPVEVLAATPVEPAGGGQLVTSTDFGTILSGMEPGDVLNIGMAVEAADGTKSEPDIWQVPWATIAATMKIASITEDRSTNQATVEFVTQDASGQADDLYTRNRVGSEEFPAYGSPKASPPISGVVYSEVFDLVEGPEGSQASALLDQTLRGKSRSVEVVSPVLSLGDQPRIYGARIILDRETGEVSAQGTVYFGVSYVKLLVTTNGTAPTLANCRLEDPVNIPVNANQFSPADLLADLGSKVLATASLGDLIQILILPFDVDDNEGRPFRDEEVFAEPPQVDVVPTVSATNVVYSVSSTVGGVAAGYLEYWEEGDVAWSSDLDGDLSDESTENRTVARPAAADGPTWIKFRAVVNGKPTEGRQFFVPAQVAEALPTIAINSYAIAKDGSADTEHSFGWSPSAGVADADHQVQARIYQEDGTEITSGSRPVEGSPATNKTDTFTETGDDNVIERYMLELRLIDDVSSDVLDLDSNFAWSSGSI